ncbi:MAG: ribulose-phosphate 3-epimerase [Kiritimatiellia bacterium]
MKPVILPSLLAADPGHLAEAIRRAEDSGADKLHLDMMDGAFVPNFSYGPDVVALARKTTNLPLSVHLMFVRPDRYVKRFAEAGASTIQIHVESSCEVGATLETIRGFGAEPAIVLNPLTPLTAALPYLNLVDECLQMTVFPGYGGQKFMSAPLPKIRALRETATAAGKPGFAIMVDGGIDRNTIAVCANAGANQFVAGTALYGKPDMAAEISLFRQLASDAWRTSTF